VHYLSRFASSIANFKAVMWRKIERRGLPETISEAEARLWVERLAERFTALGLLDDEAFAQGRARSLLRRGRPSRRIQATLVAAGLAPEMAADAVGGLAEQTDDVDLDAALAFARRKRVGPYARSAAAPERRQKDLAAFARAGFSFQMARCILDMAPDEEETG
jgi:regulatory protein